MATRQELENALRKADAAGNVDDARAIAQAIRAMGQEKPTTAPQPQAVSGRVPTLEETNASNRAYMASPQAQTDRQAFEESQAAAQREDFQSLPAPMRAMIGGGSAVNNMALGVGQLAGLADGNDVAETRQNDQFMSGDIAAAGGRIGADIAMTALPLSKLGKLGGVTRFGRYATAALGGGLIGGVQPVAEGESRALNVGIGAGLGWLGEGVAQGLTKLGTQAAAAVKPEVRALYEKARSYGINLTPAQLSDSRVMKYLESQLRSLPFSGAAKRAMDQRAQWNRAVAKEIGEDAPEVTQDVYAAAKGRIGRQFEELSSRNQLPINDDVLGQLVRVQQDAAQVGDEATGKAVNSMIERLMSQTKNGALPGKAYQSLDSELGRAMKSGGEKSYYLGQLRDILRTGMDRSVSSADQAAWQTARQQYRDLKTIRDLVYKESGDGLSPQALLGRVGANNAGKESMASGSRGGLGELARIGQRIKEPASSGTAERLSPYAIGAGAVANLPLTLAALVGGNIGGRALNSSTLARLMLREGRGQGAKALAPFARPVLVGATPIVTQKKPDDSRKRP